MNTVSNLKFVVSAEINDLVPEEIQRRAFELVSWTAFSTKYLNGLVEIFPHFNAKHAVAFMKTSIFNLLVNQLEENFDTFACAYPWQSPTSIFFSQKMLTGVNENIKYVESVRKTDGSLPVIANRRWRNMIGVLSAKIIHELTHLVVHFALIVPNNLTQTPPMVQRLVKGHSTFTEASKMAQGQNRVALQKNEHINEDSGEIAEILLFGGIIEDFDAFSLVNLMLCKFKGAPLGSVVQMNEKLMTCSREKYEEMLTTKSFKWFPSADIIRTEERESKKSTMRVSPLLELAGDKEATAEDSEEGHSGDDEEDNDNDEGLYEDEVGEGGRVVDLLLVRPLFDPTTGKRVAKW